jgi:hypothetical protein
MRELFFKKGPFFEKSIDFFHGMGHGDIKRSAGGSS